ncbi:MAG TPA: hypothetical protein VN317_01945 [Candidatus Methanoperedens sp.]|nr:hypothetical protein [Candidatus Methanoperedens sp.]
MKPSRAAGMALALLVLLCFLPILQNDFVNYDDDRYVTANRHLDAGGPRQIVGWAFTSFDAANWHPLTWLSHALDVALFGRMPRGHHLTSLLLHVANALLLFLLLRALTGALWRSFFVAGIFGLHPLHVESVAWVAERKDLLSTLFLWLSLLAYRLYLAHRSAPRYLAAVLLYALGLMAKPMLVTLPAVLLLLDWWPLGRLRIPGRAPARAAEAAEPAWRILAEKIPFLALSLLSVAVTLVAQSHGGAVKDFQEYPPAVRFGNAVVSVVRYLGKTLWPRDLAVFYPHPGGDLLAAHLFLAAAVLAVLTALVALWTRKRPYLAAGWLWYLVTLSPVLGLIQVGAQAMADRYTYVPLTGLALAAAWGLAAIVPPRPPARALAGAGGAAILVALGLGARSQLATWRTSVTLFEHALRTTRDNFVAHDNLAVALSDQGRTQEALRHALAAVRIRPDRQPGRYLHLARSLRGQGMHTEAVEVLELAARLSPGDANIRQLLAAARTAAASAPQGTAPPAR